MAKQKRRRKFHTKITAAITKEYHDDLSLLKLRTGKTKAELVREGINIVIQRYRETGMI